MRFKIEHSFSRISREAYERLFVDEEFNAALKPVCALRSRELLERREEGGRLFRKVRVVPERDFPPAIKKLITGELSYTEESWLDPTRHVLDWTSKTSILTEKLSLSGQVSFHEIPDGCRRVLEGEIKVNVFGVGRLVEKGIIDNLEETYDKIALFTQQWIDKSRA